MIPLVTQVLREEQIIGLWRGTVPVIEIKTFLIQILIRLEL